MLFLTVVVRSMLGGLSGGGGGSVVMRGVERVGQLEPYGIEASVTVNGYGLKRFSPWTSSAEADGMESAWLKAGLARHGTGRSIPR